MIKLVHPHSSFRAVPVVRQCVSPLRLTRSCVPPVGATRTNRFASASSFTPRCSRECFVHFGSEYLRQDHHHHHHPCQFPGHLSPEQLNIMRKHRWLSWCSSLDSTLPTSISTDHPVVKLLTADSFRPRRRHSIPPRGLHWLGIDPFRQIIAPLYFANL